MESIVSGNRPYEKTKSGGLPPNIGIDPWGLARGGALAKRAESMVATSHGSIFGCRVKLVNHSQPPKTTGTQTSARERARTDLALTAHLHRSMLAKQGLDTGALVGRALDPHPIVAVAEPRIVSHGHRETRDAGVGEHADHRRKRSDQHHDLESEDRVRNPRGDRLSADDD